MEYKITIAEVCELAHRYTARECAEKNIELDTQEEEDEVRYTPEAQEVFDKHYDLITITLGV